MILCPCDFVVCAKFIVVDVVVPPVGSVAEINEILATCIHSSHTNVTTTTTITLDGWQQQEKENKVF